ncbi:carbohydrate ABC transporter substrate-binding protein, CUT1 family [Alicyclobacillus hesperidum]|uniref:Carbohydrate ABC transporter substrate-binding protein, CUT1 family n=1 Tax=Alicyclobacillus hesperidum TaxID=89784 RepID=A0A1H2VXE2_9BACL|nr:extracellular solute-binding protein [Alicyclobacillus hesperidum]SDW73038.1 carbohydrate ABC transporter substrate-binding protein, CUT1 family [Alicyclobacillus hesperidum]
MKRYLGFTSATVVATLLLATGCGSSSNSTSTNGTSEGGSGGNGQKVTLEFLQNKPEVVNEWNTLIKKFEQQNPNIQVKQINPPNTDTTLQADLAKGQVPDVVAMGADATFIQMAKNGVFKDLSGAPELQKVSQAYVKMLEEEVGKTTPYAIPYTVNAVPIIYNVELFDKYHLSVPKTWNQLMSEAEKIKQEGGTPFYNGFKDAWTIAPIWNALSTNTEGSNFLKNLASGKTTFSKSDVTAANQLRQFVALGQPNQFGVDYNDANAAFANGKSVFYAQGIWTIPVLRSDNPKIQLGTFVVPATNNPSQIKMVSGVDSLLAVANSGNATKENAAMKFIDFLLQQKNAGQYATIAGLFSTVSGVKNTDPALTPLQPYITSGRVVDFDDHYYPAAMAAGNQYESVLQGALSKNQSTPQLLQQLDSLYQSAAAHQ